MPTMFGLVLGILTGALIFIVNRHCLLELLPTVSDCLIRRSDHLIVTERTNTHIDK